MATTPCPKCGATKTESVHHGLTYKLARVFGYRLRKCSRCQRWRLPPRHEQQSAEPAEASNQQEHEDPFACPNCGNKDYRRSRRRWWERIIDRGPMVRCRICRRRYAVPLEEH